MYKTCIYTFCPDRPLMERFLIRSLENLLLIKQIHPSANRTGSLRFMMYFISFSPAARCVAPISVFVSSKAIVVSVTPVRFACSCYVSPARITDYLISRAKLITYTCLYLSTENSTTHYKRISSIFNLTPISLTTIATTSCVQAVHPA
jgi:hypothetical protein